MRAFIALPDDALGGVVGGAARLDPGVPAQTQERLLAQCGPQIDAYTRTRQASAAHPTDTRAQIDMITAGRSLALCATNAGFDPPQDWRGTGATGGGRR